MKRSLPLIGPSLYLLLAVLTVSAGLLTASCAGRSRQVTFDTLRDGNFSARQAAAEVVQDSVKGMLEKGFTKLGDLSVTVDTKEGGPDATTVLRQDAAARGGDAVRLLASNVPSIEDRYYYEYQYQSVRAEGWERQMTGQSFNVDATGTLKTKQVAVLLSRGEVWRKDPAMAAKDLNSLGLAMAALSGNRNKIDEALKAGADPNFISFGMSPLMAAAMSGREDTVRRLLAAGADPDRADQFGQKPWHLAASEGKGKAALLLSEHTPLAPAVAAAAAGDAKALRVFSARSPKVPTTAWDETAIAALASRAADPAALKTLSETIGVGTFMGTGLLSTREKYLDHLLFLATVGGNYEFMQRLIDAGAPPDHYDTDRKLGKGSNAPLLHYAVMGGDIKAARILLKGGAPASSQELSRGFYPLHWAVEPGNLEMAALLLAYGASPNVSAKPTAIYGKETTPRYMSVMNDLLRSDPSAPRLSDLSILLLDNADEVSELVSLSLSQFFHIGEPNWLGKPSKEWLLARARVWNKRAREEMSRGKEAFAFDLYRVAGRIQYDPGVAAERVTVLKKLSAKPLIDAAKLRWWSDAAYLLDHGQDAQEKDVNGWTVSHFAVEHLQPELIRVLLDRGMQPGAYTAPPPSKQYAYRGTSSGSPIHAAAYKGDAALVKALVKAGDRVDRRNDNGATPLMMAAMAGKTACVLELIAAGADVNARSAGNETGWAKNSSVLEFALFNHKETDTREVVRVLLEKGAAATTTAYDGTPLVSWAQKRVKDKPEFAKYVHPDSFALLKQTVKN